MRSGHNEFVPGDKRKIDDVGKLIQLIRWTRCRDEWTPHYAVGQVIANTATTWTLDANGGSVDYDKDQWALYCK